jgi:hypothetical protein
MVGLSFPLHGRRRGAGAWKQPTFLPLRWAWRLSTSEEQGRHSWPRRPVPSAGGQAGEPQGARLLRSSLLLLFFD